MAGEKISSLPAVSSALVTDFFPEVQGGITGKETLQQVFDLFQSLVVGIQRWNEINITSDSMSVNQAYITNNAALVTLNLPVTSNVGDQITIVGKGAGGWLISQNAGQNILIGESSSTVGVTGSVASRNTNDSVNLVCTVADTTWTTNGAPQSAGGLLIV